MRVEDLLIFGKSYCHSDHVKLLLADLLNLNPLELLNHLDEYVDEGSVELFKKEIISLKEGKPLQYVIGSVNFYGNKFIVNENVLIPRFETEELVENTIKYIKKHFEKPVRILDIGCGSGVIGLTLKEKLKEATVDLLDISEDALKIAKQNADNLNLSVNFIKSDVFENVENKYDVIVSNPPYIKTNEDIEEIVKNNEPHIALYAGEKGLDVYTKILENVNSYLNEKALIAFEIGCSQKEDIIALARKNLTNIKIESKKDLSNKDRMIFILKNIE